MPRTRNMENKTIPRPTIFKLLKISDEEKILKAPREKKALYYRGTNIRIRVDFLSKTMIGLFGFVVVVVAELYELFVYFGN